MSNKTSYLALRIEGPMQSWGFDSQFNRRNTGLWPTKSAIAGMICASYGYYRGSQEEHEFLKRFQSVRMTSILIPRGILYSSGNKELMLRRLTDYHTVQGTVRASGKLNENAVLTHRQYLNDASFGVILSGDGGVMESIGNQIKDPVWGVWLGRKSCIPTAPVFAGIFNTEDESLRSISNGVTGEYMAQREVDVFSDGKDSISDQAISFTSSSRSFVPRRVIVKPIMIR